MQSTAAMTAEPDTPHNGPIKATPRLARFTAAYAANAAADALVAVTLANSLFFSISPDASRQQVLLYLVITLVPFTFLAPLIGPAIDRFPGSHRLIATSIFALRAGLVIGLAFTLYDLYFYFFGLAILIAGRASGITKQALVPGLVERPEHLVSANSRLARVNLITGTVAAPIGAGLVAIFNEFATLGLACAALLVAAAFASTLPATIAHDDPDELPADTEFLQLHTPMVAATAWAFTMIRGAVGLFSFGIVFALRRDSEPVYVYGAVAGAWALGTFAGNVLAPVLRRRTREDRLTAGSLLALAAIAAFGALGPSRPLIMLVAAVIGLAASIGRQGFEALIQALTPVTSRGGAFARYETRFQLGWVAGAIIATAIGLPARFNMAVIAVAMIPSALFYLRNLYELRLVGADEPFNPVGLARQRIDRLAALDHGTHAGVAAVELASVADLTRATGFDLDPPLGTRVSGMRDRTLQGEPPDETQLREAIAQMRAVVARMEQSAVNVGPSNARTVKTGLFRLPRRPTPKSSP